MLLIEVQIWENFYKIACKNIRNIVKPADINNPPLGNISTDSTGIPWSTDKTQEPARASYIFTVWS